MKTPRSLLSSNPRAHTRSGGDSARKSNIQRTPKLGEMGKTGINARNIRQDWLMRLLCNWLALHTSEPVPEGADPQNPAPFSFGCPML